MFTTKSGPQLWSEHQRVSSRASTTRPRLIIPVKYEQVFLYHHFDCSGAALCTTMLAGNNVDLVKLSGPQSDYLRATHLEKSRRENETEEISFERKKNLFKRLFCPEGCKDTKY